MLEYPGYSKMISISKQITPVLNIVPFQDIFANMDSGKERLENTLAKSDLVLPETSHQGQDLIQEELNMLTTEYDGFSQDCEDLQDTLGKTNHTIVLKFKSQYPLLR